MLSEQERHWSGICLGIVTIATAAIGIAMFGSDLLDIAGIPGTAAPALYLYGAKSGFAALALLMYIRLLFEAGKGVLAAPDATGTGDLASRRQTTRVYTLFVGELLALICLLIANLFLNLLMTESSAEDNAAALLAPAYVACT